LPGSWAIGFSFSMSKKTVLPEHGLIRLDVQDLPDELGV
jgi:hypothetical protein